MIYNTIVRGDDRFFREFLIIAGRINEEQIFSRIFIKGYSEQNVLNFLDEVNSGYARFRKEKRELDEKASDYNMLYATDCNGCFSKAEEYIKLIEKGMKSEMKIFKRFCAINRNKFPYVGGQIVELSALNHSDLGADYVQKLIPFSEDELTNHPKLRELANEIIKFSNEFTEIIKAQLALENSFNESDVELSKETGAK